MGKLTKLTLIFLFLQILTVSPYVTSTENVNTLNKASDNQVQPQLFYPEVDESAFITNVVPNSDFEDFNSNDQPEDWDISTDAYRNYTEYYTDITPQEGAYALQFEVQGYSNSENNYLYQGLTNAFLNETLTLSADMYIHNPTLLQNSFTYFWLDFRSQTLGSKYMSIYLSYPTTNPTNGSTYSYFLLNQSLDSWVPFTFDLSAAFTAVYGSISDYRLGSLYLYIGSSAFASESSFLVADDMKVENLSATNYITNGGFESGIQYWSSYGKHVPSSFKSTTMSSSGNKALNITSVTTKDDQNSDTYLSRYYYSAQSSKLLQEDATYLTLDYNYDDYGYDSELRYIYYFVRLTNSTFNAYLYYYIDLDWKANTPTNFTTSSYMYAHMNTTNFHVNGTWNTVYLDLFAISTELGLMNMAVYEIRIDTYIGIGGISHFQLLVDNFGIVAYPGSDVGFEGDFDNNPNTYFDHWSGINSYVTPSNDVINGANSMNITIENSGSSYVSTQTFVKIPDSLFTYFNWKLIDFDELGDEYAMISLYFEGNWYLNYLLGYNPNSGIFTNSSNFLYYVVDDVNVKSSWNRLQRNVADDLDSYFGTKQWNLTEIGLQAYSNPAKKVSILFDDLHFVNDTHGPAIDNFVISDPKYYEDVDIVIEASDILSEISSVDVFVLQDSVWVSYPTTKVNGNYEATLPTSTAGSELNYYFRLVDGFGNENIDDNNGNYYKYVIGDDIKPNLSIIEPFNNSIVTDEFTIDISASDIGSGLQRVELFLDSNLLANLTTSPFEFDFNSRSFNNGTYELRAVAYDLNGNFKETKIYLTLNNDLSAPNISDIVLNPSEIIPEERFTMYTTISDNSDISSVQIFTKLNGGSWSETDMNHESGDIYSFTHSGIKEGDTLFYYIEAIDAFEQMRSKGNEANPLEISIPSPDDSFIGGLVNDATDIYEDYTFFVGVATPIFAYLLVKTFGLIRKRRK